MHLSEIKGGKRGWEQGKEQRKKRSILDKIHTIRRSAVQILINFFCILLVCVCVRGWGSVVVKQQQATSVDLTRCFCTSCFQLFTGITTLILCLIFMAFYYFGLSESATVTLVELIINVIWGIFWLSTAAVLSSITSGSPSDVKASTAFAWLTFFLWILSTFLTFRDVKERRSPSTVPPPAVGMV